MLTYPGDPEVTIMRTSDMRNGDVSNVSIVSMSTHTGTHVDPPIHFVEDGATIDAGAARHARRPGVGRRHARGRDDRSRGAGGARAPVRPGAPAVPHRLVGPVGGAVARVPGRRDVPVARRSALVDRARRPPGGNGLPLDRDRRRRHVPRAPGTARRRTSRSWKGSTCGTCRRADTCSGACPSRSGTATVGPRGSSWSPTDPPFTRGATTDPPPGSRTRMTTCRTPTSRAPTA